MDKNKLKVLQEINYAIPVTCGICLHGRFDGQSNFGVCAKFTYDHLKHTTSKRNLSIFISGGCPKAEIRPEVQGVLETWKEFIK